MAKSNSFLQRSSLSDINNFDSNHYILCYREDAKTSFCWHVCAPSSDWCFLPQLHIRAQSLQTTNSSTLHLAPQCSYKHCKVDVESNTCHTVSVNDPTADWLHACSD